MQHKRLHLAGRALFIVQCSKTLRPTHQEIVA